MKIIAFSDGHGYLPKINYCDLVLICGDISPISIQTDNDAMKLWFKTNFDPWINKLHCDKILFIGGNHDQCLEEEAEYYKEKYNKNNKCTYLLDSEYIYNDLKIYGTPWCKKFGNWNFNKTDVELRKIYDKIPNDVDILLTHDVPFGINDMNRFEQHIGNQPLREIVNERNIKLHLCGHIHEANKNLNQILNPGHITYLQNVSIVDFHYTKDIEPVIINIDSKYDTIKSTVTKKNFINFNH